MKWIGMLGISLACTVGCKSWMLSQLVIVSKDQIKYKQHLDLSSSSAWFITDKHPYSWESYPLAISKKSLHMSVVAHQAGAYPGFCSMKGIGVFLLPLDGMLLYCRIAPSSKFASTHLYTGVERGSIRVKDLVQEHDAVPRPGLQPGLPVPESTALTIRPLRIPPCSSFLTSSSSFPQVKFPFSLFS